MVRSDAPTTPQTDDTIGHLALEREAFQAFPRTIENPASYIEALERFQTDPVYAKTLADAMFVIQGIDQSSVEGEAEDYWTDEDGDGFTYYITDYLTRQFHTARSWKLARAGLERLPESQRLPMAISFPEYDPYDLVLATLICPDCTGVIEIESGGNISDHWTTIDPKTLEETGERVPNLLPGLSVAHKRGDIAPRIANCVRRQQWFERLIGLGATGAMSFSFLADTPERQAPAEPEWLIEGIFARGDYWSLFGPAGVGKSLLALDWSLQIARSGARVLYLDKENTERMIGERLKAMGAMAEDALNLAVIPFPDLRDLATKEGAEDLMKLVGAHRPDLIVLDTISKFSTAGQAVQSDRWQSIYKETFEPLMRRGVAIGQIDHTGLADQTRERDSGAKRDNVSLAYSLLYSGPGRLRMTRRKNRPGYGGDDAMTVIRSTSPTLSHRIGQGGDVIDRLIAELDRLEVPTSAGAPTAKTALREAGIAYASNDLTEAIRIRKHMK